MNFKNHLIAGTATSLIVGGGTFYLTRNIEQSIAFGLIALAGSQVSDIDTGSIPSRIFAWLGIAVSVFLLYLGYPTSSAVIGIIYMAFSSSGHRGLTHKWILPITCFIIAAISFKFPNMARYVWLAPFGVGICVHLIIDKIPPYKII